MCLSTTFNMLYSVCNIEISTCVCPPPPAKANLQRQFLFYPINIHILLWYKILFLDKHQSKSKKSRVRLLCSFVCRSYMTHGVFYDNATQLVKMPTLCAPLLPMISDPENYSTPHPQSMTCSLADGRNRRVQ